MPESLAVICSAVNPARWKEGRGFQIAGKARRRWLSEKNTKRNARLMPLNSFYIFLPQSLFARLARVAETCWLNWLPPILLVSLYNPYTLSLLLSFVPSTSLKLLPSLVSHRYARQCFKIQRPCSIAGKCKSHWLGPCVFCTFVGSSAFTI